MSPAKKAAAKEPRRSTALVLVSHSRPLAEAVAALARQMSGEAVKIICAAGAGEDGEMLGTDAVAIMQAIETVAAEAPEVVVLMDLGSAILSTDLALDMLAPDIREKVHPTGCAFVEGAVAAAALAAGGAGAAEIVEEAAQALHPKQDHLGEQPAAAPAAGIAPAPTDISADAVILDPNGLHARPAARIVALAGTFNATVTIANAARKAAPVPATSMVALSKLAARGGDTLTVAASGPQAQEAVAALRQLIGELTGTDDAPAPQASGRKAASGNTASRAIPVAPGIAIGPAIYLNRAMPQIPTWKAEDTSAETAELKRALSATQKSIGASLEGRTSGDIFVVQLALLRDPAIIDEAISFIEKHRLNAAAAWNQAIENAAKVYAELDDPYLKAREADVRDVGRAVLRAILKESAALLPKDRPCVLIADDLAPSEAAQLDPAQFLGVIDRRGGPTSHAAILLRAAGIPSVAGAAAFIPADGARIVGLDGATGEVWVDPDAKTADKIIQKRAAWKAATQVSAEEATGKVALRDGREIQLWANVSAVADARAARQAGAIGVGLLRTEMFFLDRAEAPSEEEQKNALAAIFEIFTGCPIVVRTLDIGGDKLVPYLHIETEANPYLGVRGLRLCLAERTLFETQLRAILRAGHGHDIRIMFPMVTEVSELAEARAILETVHQSLAKAKVPHAWPVPTGIMVEVPSAAIMAQHFAPHADFFSIGTNDLTQYVLAAERGHPQLGAYADSAHPAVLRLIQEVVEAGRSAGRPVSICGEAAADPGCAMLLTGLGIKRLSMGAASIAGIRRMLRDCSFSALEAVTHAALARDDAASARLELQSLKG